MIGGLTKKWKLMQPKHKKMVFIAGGLASVIALAYVFDGDSEAEKKLKRIEKYETTSNVLGTQNTREAGIDHVSRQVRSLQSNLDGTMKKFDEIAKTLQQQQEMALRADEKTRKEMLAEIERLRAEMDSIKTEEAEAEKANKSVAKVQSAAAGEKSVENKTQKQRTIDDYYSNDKVESAAETTEAKAPAKLREIVDESLVEKAKAEKVAKDAPFRLPAGSLLSGVLISGMEAGAGKNAKRNATPALMRVSKEAVLPNRYTADVRECFVTLNGFGELASERAYMRAEYISCVKDDGTAIEAKLNAFATGEDGKAGIRGKLVTRNGQMISNAMMAGFLGGFADFATVRPVTTFGNLQGSDRYAAQMESLVSGAGIGGVAMRGTSKAMDKIADYYMTMADQSFPIVSIDAGREVTLIVQAGASLANQAQQGQVNYNNNRQNQNNQYQNNGNNLNRNQQNARNQQQNFSVMGSGFDVERMEVDDDY